MTIRGKCETCRRRKVKCDLARPICGACQVRSRSCQYFEVDSIFISERGAQDPGEDPPLSGTCSTTFPGATKDRSLKLKRHSKAKAGQGCFLTFEPTKLPSLRNAMLCPQTAKVSRGVSVFGYEALQLNPFGTWIKLGWSSAMGNNTCLELASQYVLDSMLAFQSGHDLKSLRQARQTGTMAIRSLQTEIESSSGDENKQKLLVAVMLHWAAERFIEHGSWRHIPHLLGARKLLEGWVEGKIHNQVVQNVVSTLCVDEIVSSILWGQTSPLETITRPTIPPTGAPDVDNALTLVDELLIKLPRLVRLVRTLQHDDLNIGRITEVAEVAEGLYNPDSKPWIEAAVEASSRTQMSTGTSCTSPLGAIMEFDSMAAFKLATRYHLYRLIICSIVHSLIQRNKIVGLFFPRELAEDAERGETAAATSIAMSMDYAMGPGPAKPLTALALLLPMQVCVASWYRLQMRTAVIDEALHRQAVRMMEWSSESVIRIKEMWRGRWQSWARTQSLCDVFVGGPLPEGWYTYQGDQND